MHHESVRMWARRALADAGERAGLTIPPAELDPPITTRHPPVAVGGTQGPEPLWNPGAAHFLALPEGDRMPA